MVTFKNIDLFKADELQQATVRMALATSVSLFVLLRAVFGEAEWHTLEKALTVLALYLAVSLCMFLYLLKRPAASTTRRAWMLVADLSVTSVAAVLGGEVLAPFFLVYLWIVIGYGVRYGRRFLWVATILGSSCFAAVVLVSDFWRSQHMIGIGLAATIAVIPLFTGTLFRKSEAAVARAEKANNAKSEYVRVINHDLRQGVGTIAQIAASLMRNAAHDHRVSGHAIDLLKVSQALLTIIERVLVWEQFEAGEFPTVRSEIDLLELINSCLVAAQPLASSNGTTIDWVVDCDGFSANVVTDRAILFQCLFNVVQNAANHVRDGTIRVTTSTTPLSPSELLLNISVVDDGPGFDLQRSDCADLDHNASLPSSYSTHGIGLRIVRRLAEVLDATVDIRSKPSIGTEVTFAVPVGRPVHTGDDTDFPRTETADMTSRTNSILDTSFVDAEAQCATVRDDLQPRHRLNAPIPIAPATGSPHIEPILVGKNPQEFRRIAHFLNQANRRLARASEPYRGPQSTRRILLLEDEPVSARYLSTELRARGYFVEIVSTVVEARQKLLSDSFDAVITDYHLESGTSESFVSELSNRADAHNMRIFVVSADQTQTLRKQFDKYANCAVLQKPLDVDSLLKFL